MLNIVFTGPAYDSTGKSILRADLGAACLVKGNLKLQSSVRGDTNILVASRTDTVKAQKAKDRGVAVFSYPEFIGKFLRGVDLVTGAKPDKYTDKVDLDLLVPYFGGAQELGEIDYL